MVKQVWFWSSWSFPTCKWRWMDFYTDLEKWKRLMRCAAAPSAPTPLKFQHDANPQFAKNTTWISRSRSGTIHQRRHSCHLIEMSILNLKQFFPQFIKVRNFSFPQMEDSRRKIMRNISQHIILGITVTNLELDPTKRDWKRLSWAEAFAAWSQTFHFTTFFCFHQLAIWRRVFTFQIILRVLLWKTRPANYRGVFLGSQFQSAHLIPILRKELKQSFHSFKSAKKTKTRTIF